MRTSWGLAQSVVVLSLLVAGSPARAGVVVDIPNNATVVGTILAANDSDEYRFDVTARSGLGINVKTSPGVFVDLGLSLLAPSGGEVDLTSARVYRDRSRRITVGGLRVVETGTYRLFVTAAAPCAYRLKLSTTPCAQFSAALTLPAGGEAVTAVSAPAHSRLRLRTRARLGSAAEPRLMQLGPFDLAQAGRFSRRRHRVSIPDTGETRDFELRVRDLGGLGGRVRVTAAVTAPRVPRSRLNTRDQTEITSIAAGDGQVLLEWLPTLDAESYTVYWSASPGVGGPTNPGTAIPGITEPRYAHTGLTNGLTYYYAVTATCALHGERGLSGERAARPLPTPEAPLNVAATVTEEASNSLTITWDPPLVGADSYTIYWSTTAGVAVGTNPIPGVTSPFVHTGLSGGTAYYYVVTSTLFGVESEASSEVTATPRGSPSGGGDTGYGNNLSFPAVFADGYGITGLALGTDPTPHLDTATGLRPTAEDVVDPFPYFDPADAVVRNLVTYYRQQSASTWQADWVDGSAAPQEVVVDWGDNLRSQTFRATSVVRIETTLLQDTTLTAPEDTLSAYEMALLEGSGITELQGTSGVTYESNVRTVYTVHPRLLIQKLTGPGGAVDESVPGIDLAAVDRFGTDGPGTYGAEINVAGKLVYGFVWMLNDASLTEEQKLGWWRITFALDPQVTIGASVVLRNTTLGELDPGDVGPTTGLAADGSSSWIEVQVQ